MPGQRVAVHHGSQGVGCTWVWVCALDRPAPPRGAVVLPEAGRGCARLGIDRLQQAWGFDVGKGRISAFGTVAGGERFEYGWGGGTVIGRAPWEPATVPNLRTVACGD